MSDYYRQERTQTIVRHVMATPAPWVEVQKLLRTVLQDMGERPGQPADDEVWYEVGDDEIAICYALTVGTNGGPSDAEPLR